MAGKETFLMALILVAALALPTGIATAQNLGTYDDKLIAQFNPADSQDTIRAGTRITTANWQQYRKYMTVSLQAFMSGNYFWKMGSGPGDDIEVGPTIPTDFRPNTLVIRKNIPARLNWLSSRAEPTKSGITVPEFLSHGRAAGYRGPTAL